MRWRRTHKVLTGCFVSLGLFFILEGILEFLGIRVFSQSEIYVQKVTSWRLESNLQKRRIQTKHDQHDFLVSTNNDGLRTSLSKESRNIDIAFLGDSNIFGWGVDDDETYDAQLQKNHPHLKILNAGQPGHSSFQSYELFTEYLPLYKPKWTILVLSMHDHNQTAISDVERSGSINGIIPHIRIFLHNHLRIYSLLRSFLFVETQNQANATGETYRVRDDEREKLLKSMIEQAAVWNGKIALALFPFYEDLMATHMNRPCLEWSQKMKQLYNVPVIDIHTCCLDPNSEWTFHFDHGHLNSKGINSVIPHLQEELMKEGIIDID